ARLAVHLTPVFWAYRSAHPRTVGTDPDPVSSARTAARAAVVWLRPALAGASLGGPAQCHLGTRAARARDRRLRSACRKAAPPRVCPQHARGIHLPGPQTPRLGSGRDRARRPRASRSVAAGGLSGPLVAGTSGRLVPPSGAAHP